MPKTIRKEDLDAPVLTIDEVPMHYSLYQGKEPVLLTVRLALRVGLTGEYRAEGGIIDGDAKFRRYELARKINDATDDFDVNDNEFDEAMKCFGWAWGPEVVGYVYQLLSFKQKQ